MPDQPTIVLRLPDGRYVTPEQAQGMTFHDGYKPVGGVWRPQPSPREASGADKQHDDGPRALSPDEINADLAEYMGWIPYRCLDKRDAWQPAAAAKDAVFRNPTECLNACAVVAKKAGAMVLFDEGIPLATVTAGAGRAANADDEPVSLAVATALHRLIYPQKHTHNGD